MHIYPIKNIIIFTIETLVDTQPVNECENMEMLPLGRLLDTDVHVETKQYEKMRV